ncbi:unnamed protein product [Lactuca saligna]|uniref:Uncharacterized protein n=1 Tax=Lactuca saligna TaxID=75948 RepID=A0AA36EPQ1_LACSI|nr:unnamed protein product [Lactuca saligna]
MRNKARNPIVSKRKLPEDGGATAEKCSNKVLIHKSRKRKRDVLSRLTTSLLQKETSVDLRMAQPVYGTKITKQRNAYQEAREPLWPTIDGRTMPSQRVIRDSKSESTRTCDDLDDTPSDIVKSKINRCARNREWYSHQAAWRHSPRLQHALGKKEGKVHAPLEHER